MSEMPKGQDLADTMDPSGWSGGSWHGMVGKFRLGSSPSWLSPEAETIAVQLNDVLGWTLPQIADWVDDGMPLDILDRKDNE